MPDPGQGREASRTAEGKGEGVLFAARQIFSNGRAEGRTVWGVGEVKRGGGGRGWWLRLGIGREAEAVAVATVAL